MNNEDIGRDAAHYQEGAANDRPAETAAPGEGEFGMEALLRDNDYAFRSVRRGETVEGTVVRVDQDEVLVDIGLKSEGVIPSREMYSESEDTPSLHVGDHALVYVLQPESAEGHAVLSLRRARAERSWREIEEIYNEGGIIEAPVVDHNKGGLIVDVRGIRGFVPVSQVLDLRNVGRQEGENEEITQALTQMQGRRLPLKIIEINRGRNRLILSERAAVQERRSQRKDQIIDQLEPGQVRRGTVSNLTSFGAFIDLGGADGLVHVAEHSNNRVNHPSELVQDGQEVDVFVLSVDKDTRKIALSLKRAQPDPWTTVEQRYHVGEVVPATITKLAKFGAFAKVQEGLEGLIHTSELTDLPVQDPSQVVHENQQVNVKIIHINSQRRRLGLSVRQAVTQGGQAESFGEVDEVSPFAGQDYSRYGGYVPPATDACSQQPDYVDATPAEPDYTPSTDFISAPESGSQQDASDTSAESVDLETVELRAPEDDSPATEPQSEPTSANVETAGDQSPVFGNHNSVSPETDTTAGGQFT